MATRKGTEIPHIEEQPLEEILGAKSPTKGDVFRHFWYLRFVKKLSTAEAQKNAVNAAKRFWTEAGVVIKSEVCAIKELAKMWNDYRVNDHDLCFHLEIHRICLQLKRQTDRQTDRKTE